MGAVLTEIVVEVHVQELVIAVDLETLTNREALRTWGTSRALDV